MSGRRIRIGIDVGGTFTHAVAVDAARVAVVGKAKVPTTHHAAEGVARGIVESLTALLESEGIAPEEIALIAHSTTQATNALLEGDVAVVGIVGMGRGLGAVLAKTQTRIGDIPLGARRRLRTLHTFLRSDEVTIDAALSAVDRLRAEGAEVIVAAEAFSVDDPTREEIVCQAAAQRGLPATATHHVSRLHGLGIRTRTAVINASMVPKMLATANLTERAVRDAGITAPIMIMRSDGGIMDIAEMRRRPILTMLSGPAAGVAAALLYARMSDGIFLEVGGTSTDISVIKNGRTQIRSAQVGGNRLFLSTLDVRTVGVAGGSVVYLDEGKINQVGPRSAHIAGLPYLSFTDGPAGALQAARHDHEGETYLAVRSGDATLAITTTCAANRLGLVPAGDPAGGNAEIIARGLDVAAPAAGCVDGEALATAILDKAIPKVEALAEGLIADYELDRGVLRLVAGGGGGSAIVPYLARKMGRPFTTVENADVISAIGVALALVRETVERTVISPTDEEIRKIRAEAIAGVLKAGASAESVEVYVQVDAKRNLLRAIAEGSLEIREQDLRRAVLTEAERRELVAASMGAGGADRASESAAPTRIARVAGFEVWAATRRVPRLWRFFPQQRTALRVLDVAGTIRWATSHGAFRACPASRAATELAVFAEEFTRYSDAGATIPACFALLDGRVLDFSGLTEMHQVVSVFQEELSRADTTADCGLLLSFRSD